MTAIDPCKRGFIEIIVTFNRTLCALIMSIRISFKNITNYKKYINDLKKILFRKIANTVRHALYIIISILHVTLQRSIFFAVRKRICLKTFLHIRINSFIYSSGPI